MNGAVMLLALIVAPATASPQALPSTPSAQAAAARGVLRAEHEAVLASPLSESIVSLPYQEGMHFARGATLVAFDCSRMRAELAAARAGHAAEARNAQMQSELLGLGAAGKGEADIAVERSNEKRAQAQAIEQRMAGCHVVAPFAGRVVESYVREHEAPAPNKELIRIVSQGPLELHMVLPSRWLGWLQVGTELKFAVDETRDVLSARVTRISGAVDPVSQTIRVVGAVTRAPERVLPGMSGQVSFPGSPVSDAR